MQFTVNHKINENRYEISVITPLINDNAWKITRREGVGTYLEWYDEIDWQIDVLEEGESDRLNWDTLPDEDLVKIAHNFIMDRKKEKILKIKNVLALIVNPINIPDIKELYDADFGFTDEKNQIGVSWKESSMYDNGCIRIDFQILGTDCEETIEVEADYIPESWEDLLDMTREWLSRYSDDAIDAWIF